MNTKLNDFYTLPDVNKFEDVHLLTLSEQCAVLEEKVYQMIRSLTREDQQLVEAYILARNDLEVETFKAALRWGKR